MHGFYRITLAYFANLAHFRSVIASLLCFLATPSIALEFEQLSLKTGYSFAIDYTDEVNNRIVGIESPSQNGFALNGSLIFDTDKSYYFRPYLDLAWLVQQDRYFIIPAIGLRHDFNLDNSRFQPFYSLGLGYTFLFREERPVVDTVAQSETGQAFSFSAQTGASVLITKHIGLDLTLRYDGFVIDTVTVVGDQINTIQDRGALSLLLGLNFHFGAHPVTGPNDEDMDGVIDAQDLCLGTLANVPVNEAGCPQYRFNINLDFTFAAYQMADLVNHPDFDTVAFLNKNQNYALRIIGYTDSKGSQAFNQRLSQQRADSAKQYLLEQGIAAERISVLARGENEPLFDNDTDEHRLANRRIKFEFYRSELGAE